MESSNSFRNNKLLHFRMYSGAAVLPNQAAVSFPLPERNALVIPEGVSAVSYNDLSCQQSWLPIKEGLRSGDLNSVALCEDDPILFQKARSREMHFNCSVSTLDSEMRTDGTANRALIVA